MMTYIPCFFAGLLGITLVFAGRKSEPIVIVGAVIYFFALFVAAIHSLGVAP